MPSCADAPYRDPRLPVAARVADLLPRLTLEEKIAQMLHQSPAVPRLGIPEYDWWNECLHGVGRAGKATVFPQAIGMAAAFDPQLVHQVATAISDEARAKHHQALRQGNRGGYFGLTYWSPNVNIFRDPRWGRGQETYGEDPYLTSRLGVAFVRGLQGEDPHYLKLVATPKHYAVHSGPEPERHGFDARVSQRDLRETYLPAFHACVTEAGAFSVMGAYNRTNGEACCASQTLLQRILREEWGFRGYVVSDCGAIDDIHAHHRLTASAAESAALAVRAGCDLNCGRTYGALVEAAGRGLIDAASIDRAAGRLLEARFRLGMFDPEELVPYAAIGPEVVHCAAHRQLALAAARSSIVLLKNEGGLLPLGRDQVNSVAVVGPTAESVRVLLGNYFGYSGQYVTPFEGIVEAVSVGTQVWRAEGCKVGGQDRRGFAEAVRLARQADVVVACCGYSPELEGEEGEVEQEAGTGDRPRIGLPGLQEELLQDLAAVNRRIVLVLTGGSPIALPEATARIPAILMLWYPGEQGGTALAQALFGHYSPAGRLPVTFVRSLDQVPPFADYRMQGRTYRFMTAAPQYRFGYGLSYTRFAYSGLRLDQDRIGPDATATVQVLVTNVGPRAGDEVAQLYVSDLAASVPVPRLHLEGFQRVHLEPGEARTLRWTLSPRQLAVWDDEGQPRVEPGQFRLAVGGGQPDDPASGAVSTALTVV